MPGPWQAGTRSGWEGRGDRRAADRGIPAAGRRWDPLAVGARSSDDSLAPGVAAEKPTGGVATGAALPPMADRERFAEALSAAVGVEALRAAPVG